MDREEKIANMEKNTVNVEGTAANAGEDAEKAVESRKTAKKRVTAWKVRVKNNPGFCGIGAGGVQFANGQAEVHSERMAQWFMEHEGYEVIKQ